MAPFLVDMVVRMRNCVRCLAIVYTSMLLGSAGCTIKATLNQITDTTSNMIGTTPGTAWWSEDGQIMPDFKITEFVTFNQANLHQDLATGSGVLPGLLSRLLMVPADRPGIFFHRPGELCPDGWPES